MTQENPFTTFVNKGSSLQGARSKLLRMGYTAREANILEEHYHGDRKEHNVAIKRDAVDPMDDPNFVKKRETEAKRRERQDAQAHQAGAPAPNRPDIDEVVPAPTPELSGGQSQPSEEPAEATESPSDGGEQMPVENRDEEAETAENPESDSGEGEAPEKAQE